MESALAAFLFFMLGACVGSFLNVVTLRFGYSERDGKRSKCMACDAELCAHDLFPIFSYLALRGRCRYCGSRLLLQYPLVELLTGLLFVISFFVAGEAFFGLLFTLSAAFWTTLLGLVVYDLRHTLVPLPFVYALYVFAGVAALISEPAGALWGALVCAGFFALIHFSTKGKGMGIGDAYVAGAIGLMLGLEAGIVASVLAVWSGALVGIALLLVRSHVTLKTEIPFAPFLAFGALLTWSLSLTLSALGLSLTLP